MKNSKYFKIAVLAFILAMLIQPMSAYAISSPAMHAVEEGEAHGEEFGTLEGAIAGRRDYVLGLTSNSRRNMPTDTALSNRYQLGKDLSQYRLAFLRVYKMAYDIAYQSAYREANLYRILAPLTNGSEHGFALGEIEGIVSAMTDFTQGRSNNWNLAYTRFVSGGAIAQRYYLQRESSEYQTAFIAGFEQGFQEAYTNTYQEKNLETEIRNINFKTVSMLEETIEFEEEYVQVVSGIVELDMRTPMRLHLPEGTIYEPTSIKMYKVQNTFNPDNRRGNYEPVSSKYVISIANLAGGVTLKNPVELSFEYYGSEYAGIYLWKNNRWEYQHTVLEADRISTTIAPGYYTGGSYAIFIDNGAKDISRSSHHWARNEIYTLIRRDAMLPAHMFTPNAVITRGEFASMLYGSLGSNLAPPRTVTISDADQLGAHTRAAHYMVSSRLMKLDDRGAFNPSAPMTYLEVEEVFSSLFFRTFRWQEVANAMLHQKYVRSRGLTDKTQGITRGEAAYAIIELLK